ncbi:MAG: mechanosensitive ion channel family protein [Rhodoferax sp.]|nr:mechanosensitive ion channel family protein [Rhodoferax sp.]MBP7491078.1 mechanosensitive ion channel family protein [Rhodoferax sp.]
MPEYLVMLKSFARELGAGVVIVLAAFLISRVLRRVIHTLKDSRSLSDNMAHRLQTFRQRVIFTVTLLVLMQVAGVFDNAWAFISTALLTVALGFVAAWSILSNATAAVLILILRPFRVGDNVELLDPSGEPMGGKLADMNLMFTTLTLPPVEGDLDDRSAVLNVPNNLLFQRVLRIRSRHRPDSRAAFFSDFSDPED